VTGVAMTLVQRLLTGLVGETGRSVRVRQVHFSDNSIVVRHARGADELHPLVFLTFDERHGVVHAETVTHDDVPLDVFELSLTSPNLVTELSCVLRRVMETNT